MLVTVVVDLSEERSGRDDGGGVGEGGEGRSEGERLPVGFFLKHKLATFGKVFGKLCLNKNDGNGVG